MVHPILLKSFIEIVNRSTMANAARHLKITPAAISKHIKSLEDALGIQLLKRSTRQIDLTPDGVLYFEHAKRILDAYREAEAAVSYSLKEPSGILKIVCGPQIGNLYLIPRLNEFLEKYPKLRLNIEFTQTMPDLEKEKIDAVIGLTTGLPAHWIQKTLTYARWVFCASPDYLNRQGIPKKPSDLAQHRIITRTQRKPNNRIEFKTGESLFFEPYLYFNDTRAIRRAAIQGLGIVQLQDYIVDEDLRENKLVEILSKYNEQEKTLPVQIAFPPSDPMHINVRKFIDFMVEAIKY